MIYKFQSTQINSNQSNTSFVPDAYVVTHLQPTNQPNPTLVLSFFTWFLTDRRSPPPNQPIGVPTTGHDDPQNIHHLLFIGTPGDCEFPVEPHPIMGLHVVIPLHLHPHLHPPLPPPPPPPLLPPPPCPPGPHPRPPFSLHGPHLAHHIHRHPLLCRCRDQGYAVVLA